MPPQRRFFYIFWDIYYFVPLIEIYMSNQEIFKSAIQRVAPICISEWSEE